MKHTRSKRQINHLHAKRRAMQRYGLDLNKSLHKQLAQAIRDGHATFVKRRSRTRTVWLVELEGRKIRAVYDSNQHNLVTVLPPTGTILT